MTHKIEHKIHILDKNGRFSRPEEQLDSFLQQSKTSRPLSDSVIPYPVTKAFSDKLSVNIQSMPIEQSAKGLLPWELACCWIDEDGEPMIRMRPSQDGLISKETVLVHELVHAVRGRLSSSKFEEFCAYDVCATLTPLPKWRRFLGPLFSSAKEVLFIFLALWCNFILPLFFNFHPSALALSIVPVLSISLPFARLISRWRTWNRALHLVSIHWPQKEHALLIRLADEEIIWLSKLEPSQVVSSIQEKARYDWRWQFFLSHILSDSSEIYVKDAP